jgi:aminobenzoyl-glutamate utilization protein B
VEEIYPRILKIAEGAALMSGSTLEVKFQVGYYVYLPNRVVSEILLESFRRVGAPKFSDEDFAFAQALERSFSRGQKISVLGAAHVPPEYAKMTLHTDVAPFYDWGKPIPGSTDVKDVSWITPTAQLTAATWGMGTAPHSWQATAASGMGIGQKAMIAAAKAMRLAGYKLMAKPDLLRKAKETFLADTGGKAYVSPLPPEMNAP